MTESFPRQQARTRRFSLGVPRAFAISPAGDRVTFLRGRTGTDPLTCLWQYDVASGTENLIADPTVLSAADEDLPPEEKRRRERVREQAGGIVSYAVDAAVRTAVFSLAGRVFAVDLDAAAAGWDETGGTAGLRGGPGAEKTAGAGAGAGAGGGGGPGPAGRRRRAYWRCRLRRWIRGRTRPAGEWPT